MGKICLLTLNDKNYLIIEKLRNYGQMPSQFIISYFCQRYYIVNQVSGNHLIKYYVTGNTLSNVERKYKEKPG